MPNFEKPLSKKGLSQKIPQDDLDLNDFMPEKVNSAPVQELPISKKLDARACAEAKADAAGAKARALSEKNNEFGGPKGLEPTRYGDWERAGRCCDF